MRSRMSRGVPEWFGGEELYIGSAVSTIGKVSGVTGIVPGPPEGSRGSTYPGGPRGLKWEGNHPLVGWCAPPCAPLVPRVGNPRWGGGAHHLPWVALHPPWPPPPWEIPSPGPPLQGAYIKEEGGRAAAPQALAPPSPLLHLSLSQYNGEALLR